MGRVVEWCIVLAVLLFIIYEIIVPGFNGLPLFPDLRSKVKNLKHELEEEKQQVKEERLSAAVRRTRATVAKTKQRAKG